MYFFCFNVADPKPDPADPYGMFLGLLDPDADPSKICSKIKQN
jgi:hypothetical protein